MLTRRFWFKARALLCAALVFVQPILYGCQGSPITVKPVIPGAARYHIELTSDHPMTGALSDSVFAGAKAIDIYPAVQRFEVLFPDVSRTLNGHYTFLNGEFTIVDFGYARQDEFARFTFSESKQITQITSTRGEWKRPPSSLIPPDPSLSGVEAYTAANADILEVARQLDIENGKDSGGLPFVLGVVLLYSGWLWAPIAATMQVVLTIFVVSTVLQLTVGGRFDGVWNAVNASNALELTIADGRITRIVNVSSQQQVNILESQLQQVQGTNVSWKVAARLLGQPGQVQFEFNVEELATGALSGTLTTTNGGSATVPIIMSRA